MLKVPVSEKDHYQGNLKAPIQLVEYGDYQCPFCSKAHEIVKQVQDYFNERLVFVFRNFPLVQIHKQAELAAESSEFANQFESFWSMHDLLFANQDRLSPELMLELIDTLELPIDEYERAMEQRLFLPKIKDDVTGGLQSGVNGTPTFFINGKRHTGGYSYQELIKALEKS